MLGCYEKGPFSAVFIGDFPKSAYQVGTLGIGFDLANAYTLHFGGWFGHWLGCTFRDIVDKK